MNRTLKEVTVKKFYYETHQHLKEHLTAFVNAYNFVRRLKTLQGLTPYEFIAKQWQKEPERFKVNPTHYNMGLYKGFVSSFVGSSGMVGMMIGGTIAKIILNSSDPDLEAV